MRGGQRLARMQLRMTIIGLVLGFNFTSIPDAYASFRAEEVINRGSYFTYIEGILRTFCQVGLGLGSGD